MVFRVILLVNGEYKKTLHRCKTRETAFINFHKFMDENKVMFPKKFINSHGLKPVKYQLAISKVTEEGDEFRVLRNPYGKFYTEKPLGDWTILFSGDYDIEETFWMYGMDNRNDRVTITEVVKRLMLNVHARKKVKQIIVVYNKLLIYDETQFDMVICKHIEDAQRLHHQLAKIVRK